MKDFISDKERYAETLSHMIGYRTVSEEYSEREVNALKEYLRDRFPLLRERGEWLDMDGGLLIKIAGIVPRPLVLMSHLDVVPAPGAWKYSPFSGTVADGAVWGRGAVDTKGALCAILESVESVLADGFEPLCDIYIFSGSREEIAGADAEKFAAYLKKNDVKPCLVMDEGGAIIKEPIAGIKGKFAMIALSERSRARLLLTAKNKDGKSAMSRLARFEEKYKNVALSKRKFTPEVDAMFETLAPHMSGVMKFVFDHIRLFKPLLLKLLPKMSAEAAAMIGPTVAFGNPDAKELKDMPNGVCGMSATIGCTYYDDIDECVETFADLAEDEGLDVRVVSVFRTPPCEPVGSGGYKFTADCVRAVFPQVTPSPFILFGGTDARHLIGIADSVIRFAPLYLDKEEFASFHRENEHLHIDSLADAVKFYKYVIMNIDKYLNLG